MDKETQLQALLKRCFDARVPVYQVCDRAKVARSTPSRWKKDPETMTATTLGKLENALSEIEAERKAA